MSMPPFYPRKRLGTSDLSSPRKRTKLFDVLDADPGQSSSLEAAKDFTWGEDVSDSSLSDMSSDGPEDVSHVGGTVHQEKDNGEEEDQCDMIDWEDAMAEDAPVSKAKHVPMAGGNLELNLSKILHDGHPVRDNTGVKRGPTKIERQIRLQTHRMHVQFLLYHNAIRNRWICDKDVQNILVKQLPPAITKEIQKWRVASGLESAHEVPSKDKASCPESKRKGKKTATTENRNQRDWGKSSTRLEKNKPDLSRADPIIPLLKILAAYWRKRFSVTAPGLRKIGYTSPAVRQRQIRSLQNDKHDPEEHGEKIESLEEFRRLAVKCEGSRDVGAQLFTALLRGVGVESRLVANLQPSGFGWTRNEQAETKISGKVTDYGRRDGSHDICQGRNQSGSREESMTTHGRRGDACSEGRKDGRIGAKGCSSDPLELDSSNAEETALLDSDDASIVDLTGPASPARKLPKSDQDLPFPIYWTEVVSPINSVVIPVSPLILPNPVASTPEILSTFEPRGVKADKAKQVIAYVVAYSTDGSAKDVTTRYLKRRMWPGKTRGFRIPVEKITVYYKHGKIKRYEEYDWFKSVMSAYTRTDTMRTAVDDVEEAMDLVPQQAEGKQNKEKGDTLQSLKSSAEFVLERFLRREEALKANAKPIRTFTTGKGEKLKEENVYRRADVERCLSAESWHKEGRQVRAGEAPLKLVPIRAVTLTRKREVEEMQRQTGEKPTQGLYSHDQTEYIIPLPIKDGVIPRNSYGNIDCFVPSMVPQGAVHIPIRGTVRICKKLNIDYAEAVTGFEFGKKLAIPVIEGVVVAEENESAVRAAWQEHAAQQRLKEEDKLEKAVLSLWKRMLIGLRIRERVSDTYGEDSRIEAEVGRQVETPGKLHHDALPPERRSGDAENASIHGMQDGGGFLLPQEESEDRVLWSGELVVEYSENHPQWKSSKEVDQYPNPVSATSVGIGKSCLPQRLVAESSDSSELSEAVSVNHEADEADTEAEIEGVQRRMDQGTQITSTRNMSLRKSGSQVLGSVTSDDEDSCTSVAILGRENSDYQRRTIQLCESVNGRRGSSGRARKLGSRLAASPERLLRSRRLTRKAALTSPYFEPDASDEGSGT